jgi:uncharacterized protein
MEAFQKNGMHLSRYLKSWSHAEEPGLLLLYSTKNTAMVQLPAEVYRKLLRGEVEPEYGELLTDIGMLVADLRKEQEEVFSMLAAINRLDPGINVSIILGMGCNFDCVYCYEGSQKGDLVMNEAICDQVISFIKKRFIAGAKHKLTLDFYGGEPLLYTRQLKYIAGPLQKFVEDEGGAFQCNMVTNGSLLTTKTVEPLLPLGLSSVKVTVDGPAVVHNVFRPFKSGAASFEIILNNIRACCDLVKINIGGNYTAGNYDDFPQLLDFLAGQGLTPDKIGNVRFNPVMRINDLFANPEFTGGCGSINEPWLVDASLLLREEIMRRGYRTEKLSPSPCMVDLDASFVIHYDGAIYKCVSMIGHRQYRTGNVWTGMADYSARYHADHWRKNKECAECIYLPLCFGGCRYLEFQRAGDMAKVDCQKEFLDAALEKTIQQDVRYRYQSA